MNKTNLLKNKIQISIFTGGVFMALLIVSSFGALSASAAITGYLDFGARGSQVSELQTFLSTYPTLYPSGLVTGYFGSLTQAGVQRFQSTNGIVSSGSPQTTGYGRVGPVTMARINSLLGGVSSPFWDTVPVLNNPSIQTTNTTVTFMLTTNEPTVGQIYWDTTPIRTDEISAINQSAPSSASEYFLSSVCICEVIASSRTYFWSQGPFRFVQRK